MGCDIHVRIQVRPEYYDRFKTVCNPGDSRWYLFFEMLTGQRSNNGFDGCMPSDRGLPDDIGENEYDPEDVSIFGDHSQTWWTLAEMKRALGVASKFAAIDWTARERALERFKKWIYLGEVLGEEHEASCDDDVRYVIGYDS